MGRGGGVLVRPRLPEVDLGANQVLASLPLHGSDAVLAVAHFTFPLLDRNLAFPYRRLRLPQRLNSFSPRLRRHASASTLQLRHVEIASAVFPLERSADSFLCCLTYPLKTVTKTLIPVLASLVTILDLHFRAA